MITLVDTFNGNTISQHRTVLAAVKAQRRHMAALRRRAGENAYVTYKFLRDGVKVDDIEIMEAIGELDNWL